MHKLYDYITNGNPDLIVAVFLGILFTLESIFTNTVSLSKKGTHLFHSILLQAAYFIINFFLSMLMVRGFSWIESNHIGLFNVIQIPYLIKVVLGVFCIDFTNYWAHRLYHTVEIFWRLHRVHHSDTHLDSSTAYRFHPLDSLLDNCSAIFAMLIFGLDPSILIFWFILYIPVLVLHHAAFIMPDWFDKTIGQLIVSPNYHKVHHHQLQEFTDSNYGQLFIIWDKIFKTFKTLPVKEIEFGLKEFDEPRKQTFWFLLTSPFRNLKN